MLIYKYLQIFYLYFHSEKQNVLGCILNYILPKRNRHFLNDHYKVTCSFSPDSFLKTAQNLLSQWSVTETESQAYFQGL